jgi:hypothetical protein
MKTKPISKKYRSAYDIKCNITVSDGAPNWVRVAQEEAFRREQMKKNSEGIVNYYNNKKD